MCKKDIIRKIHLVVIFLVASILLFCSFYHILIISYKDHTPSRFHPKVFYVFVDKDGTCTNEDGTPCVAGNYGPVWSQERFTYQVLGAWPEKLSLRYASKKKCASKIYVVKRTKLISV